MYNLVEESRIHVEGEPPRSGFAATHQIPDLATNPEGHAKAIQDSRRANFVYAGSLLWTCGMIFAAFGFASISSIPSFSTVIESTRDVLTNGSIWYFFGFLVAVFLMGLIVNLLAKYRFVGAFELGAALGVAYYGFTESTSNGAAAFCLLGGIIGVADGASRFRKTQASDKH